MRELLVIMQCRCEMLHYTDPYLQLGPFLLEHRNQQGNYVGQIRQLLSTSEQEGMKSRARGQMKATPYNVGNENHDFSYKRTSKIKYVRWSLR